MADPTYYPLSLSCRLDRFGQTNCLTVCTLCPDTAWPTAAPSTSAPTPSCDDDQPELCHVLTLGGTCETNPIVRANCRATCDNVRLLGHVRPRTCHLDAYPSSVFILRVCLRDDRISRKRPHLGLFAHTRVRIPRCTAPHPHPLMSHPALDRSARPRRRPQRRPTRRPARSKALVAAADQPNARGTGARG